MICSSEKGFFPSNLLAVGDWTPDRFVALLKTAGVASIAWTQRHGIAHLLIEPGKPMQNNYIESFNGKFCDECLNEHGFTSLAQARDVVAE